MSSIDKRPLTVAGPRSSHPLAPGRPDRIVVLVLVGILALVGWSAEQIIALLAMLVPASALALGPEV